MSARTNQYALLGPPGTTGDFAITTAGNYVGQAVTGLDGINSMSAQLSLAYGSGGTQIDAYLQTSVDGGNTWIDIANVEWTTSSAKAVLNFFTAEAMAAFTPSDGAITANTNQQGVLGNQVRLKLHTQGTYANTVVAGRIVVR
jgi:hypothetical protein